MTIRDRADADLPACVEALRAVHTAGGYPTAWPAEPAQWLDPAGLTAAWVAELDGAIVGHIGVLAGVYEPGLAEASGLPPERLAVVTRLFVDPVARGHGLARRLVERLVEHGRGSGLRVGLDVVDGSTAAITLYESLGWRRIDTGFARWQANDGSHPLLHYYLAPEAAVS